jgi:hypothetical protein
MGPPLKEHRVADKLKPWGELEVRIGELLLQNLRRNVLRRLHLVPVDVEVDMGLDEEDVVD